MSEGRDDSADRGRSPAAARPSVKGVGGRKVTEGLWLKLRLHWAHGACFVLGLGAAVSLHFGAAHLGYGVLELFK